MTQSVKINVGEWYSVDTSKGDVLLTTPTSYFLFMNGSTKPTGNGNGHPIAQPVIIPKGTAAYVGGGCDSRSSVVCASAMLASADAGMEPLKKAVP